MSLRWSAKPVNSDKPLTHTKILENSNCERYRMKNSVNQVSLLYLIIASAFIGYHFNSVEVLIGVGFTLAFFQKMFNGMVEAYLDANKL